MVAEATPSHGARLGLVSREEYPRPAPSRSRIRWQNERLAALDEIEAAHAAIGGTGPGRRTATQQINQAYAVLLSSQFQGFCRDLHSEAADHFARHLDPPPTRAVVLRRLLTGRKLDAGNPNPGNLGADFGGLGLRLWPTLRSLSPRTAARQTSLEELNAWRNAIAHQDFDPAKLGGTDDPPDRNGEALAVGLQRPGRLARLGRAGAPRLSCRCGALVVR